MIALPSFAQGFDFSKGIVGHLSEPCRENGNCGLCDFIHLFIIFSDLILSTFAGLALFVIIWHAIGMIMSRGSAEKFATEKKGIGNAVLAVIIILGAWTLINILVSMLTGSSGRIFTKEIKSQAWYDTPCQEK